jgi:hypothetical protein
MLDSVILGVIVEEKDARGVSEPDIILLTTDHISETDSDSRFDYEIIIREAIEMVEINIIVVNASQA